MIKAIFYKEWIKTRWYFLAMFISSISITIYTLLKIGRVITFKGADHLWAIMLTRENTFIEQIAYLPIICGILLAVTQFVPEIVQKRLKLTLHLPYSNQKMILFMVLAGFMQLFIIYMLQCAIIIFYVNSTLPIELITRMLLTATPWFLAGLTSYLFTAAICIEPTWKMRIINMLLMCGILRIFYLIDTPEAYNSMLLPFSIITIMYFTLSIRSALRFKEGYQD